MASNRMGFYFFLWGPRMALVCRMAPYVTPRGHARANAAARGRKNALRGRLLSFRAKFTRFVIARVNQLSDFHETSPSLSGLPAKRHFVTAKICLAWL